MPVQRQLQVATAQPRSAPRSAGSSGAESARCALESRALPGPSMSIDSGCRSKPFGLETGRTRDDRRHAVHAARSARVVRTPGTASSRSPGPSPVELVNPTPGSGTRSCPRHRWQGPSCRVCMQQLRRILSRPLIVAGRRSAFPERSQEASPEHPPAPARPCCRHRPACALQRPVPRQRYGIRGSPWATWCA